MNGSPQIRTAIVIAVTVVVLSAVLLLGLSVLSHEQSAPKPPATAAPIIFPTAVQRQ